MTTSTTRLLGCAVALLCSVSTGAWAQDNSAPISIVVPPIQLVTAGAIVTLDGSQSFDPEGDPFTFSWLQLLGDPVTLSDPTIAMPTFTAPLTAQTLTFNLTVTDVPWGDSSSATYYVVVSSVPEPEAAWMFGSGVLALLGIARLRGRSV